ncbi:MAG: bifunctional nuclease domain-containing protein [Bacteroidota bacterium]
MKKIAVQISTLVPSEFQTGYYTLLLKEIDGRRQLPIIINSVDAQAISQTFHATAANYHNVYSPFINLLLELNGQIDSVVIENVTDGIFSNFLSGKKADSTALKVDVKVGAALALSLQLGCMIFVNKKVMDEVGVIIEPSGKVVALRERSIADYSISELEHSLADALAKEDYKKACDLRDLIEEKKALKRA